MFLWAGIKGKADISSVGFVQSQLRLSAQPLGEQRSAVLLSTRSVPAGMQISLLPGQNPTKAPEPLPAANQHSAATAVLIQRDLFGDILFTRCVTTPPWISLWVPR